MSIPAPSAGIESAGSLASSDIRRHNLAAIAGQLAQHGTRSRSQLADGTGLTRGAVTALTTLLIEAQVVRECSGICPEQAQATQKQNPAHAPRKGRPRTALELHAPRAAILALQLDADVATALLATVTGEPLRRIERHHGRPMGQPAAVIDVLAAVLGEALDECARLNRSVLETVVVVFAPVSADPPRVLADTDLGWGTVDVLGELREREPRLSCKVVLSSDSPLAAQAERSRLPGIDELLYIKSNSGIGGASIVRGQLVSGARNMAGALGHLAVERDGEHCLCGQRGCLVTLAGPDVVLQSAGLSELLARDGLAVALTEFVHRVRTEDAQATAAWEQAAGWIAHTLELLTLAFDPAVIVLGGYWAELSDSVAAKYMQLGPSVALSGEWKLPAIVPGTLGADAALLGAVWSARERLMLDPLRMAAPAASVA